MIYHGRKHTESAGGPSEDTLSWTRLTDHVEAACRARSGWEAALARGEGWRVPYMKDPTRHLRVIDNRGVYLVMTDEADAKMVSLHGRGRYRR